mgnify:CR=1 FL=1|tara:strand:- start:714 stop:1427 length:714 start_codon:yes stop_codon:yes gene_type:complete
MEKIDTILNEYTTMEISNSFFLMNDIERMRKFLVKNFLFSKTNELPGDIVELGVFKGTGFLQLVKLLEIYFPASNKKVIGFDLFNSTNFDNNSTKQLQNYYEFCDVSNNGISKNKVKSYADKLPLANYNPSKTLFKKKKYELIEGDVCETIPVYIKENPGLRISLLYCDMDIEKPTFEALNYFYDRVVRGGIIVFDEYACNKWSESNAVDAFLKLHPELELKSITWSRTPTAYIIKK